MTKVNSGKVTDNGVRLRSSPELTQNILTSLKKDVEVVLPGGTASCDGIDWLRVITQNKMRGWMAKQYVAVSEKLVGIHAASRSNGDLLKLAGELSRAGYPIPLVVVISNPGLAEAIKQASPETVVVYRWVAGTDDVNPFNSLKPDGTGGVQHGRDWFNLLFYRHSQAPHADYHQMYNECSFQGNAQSGAYADRVAQFELELMQEADRFGVKVTVGNLAPGCLEEKHLTPLYRNMLSYAVEHGHAFNYHAYTSVNDDRTFAFESEWFAMRWVWLLRDFPTLKVLLGEAGHYHAPRERGDADLVDRLNELNLLLQEQSALGRYVRAAYWSSGCGGDPLFGGDDITAQLPTVYAPWLRG